MTVEPIKYLIAGGLAFSCDISVFYACMELLHLHYLLSNIAGYFAGLGVAYILNVRWVFSYRKYKNSRVEFLIFNIIVVTGLAISETIMALMVEVSNTDHFYAKITAGFFVMLFNYTSKKYLLFHPPNLKGQL